MMLVADVRHGDGKHLIVRADEELTLTQGMAKGQYKNAKKMSDLGWDTTF